jgi:hypothetical protein
MLRVADGCTERQFPLVPQVVLVCSYDVIGTQCYDASATHSSRSVPVSESSDPGERCARRGLFDPDEMMPGLRVADASAAPVSNNYPKFESGSVVIR